MRIAEITWRNRNDFHWIGECDCGHRERYGDGYADAFYCERVVPARHCPACGINALGEARPTDPQPGLQARAAS